jgi:hypothetical protein
MHEKGFLGTKMSIEYKLAKTKSGKYHQLSCDTAIVQTLSMYGFGDSISFMKTNKDGTNYGSYWGLRNLGCFPELKAYARLSDMPEPDLEKLAARIYMQLYTSNKRCNSKLPGIEEKPKFIQIRDELKVLQGTQKKLADLGQIVFPEISAEELKCIDSW